MPTKRTQAGFYAVRNGRETGVFETWADCEKQVSGFPNARYKKFITVEEARFFALGTLPPEVSNAAASASAWDPPDDSKTKKRPRSPDIEDEGDWDVVYSDGACKGNGQVGSVAGIGVWWGPNDSRNLAERCPGDQTNNRAELIAILRVLETVPISTKPLLIKSDSRYSIDCLKIWIYKWKANGFRSTQGEAVKNAGIIRCTSIHLDIRARYGQKVLLRYVKGHSGDVGNDGADAMANRGALLPAVKERHWEALEMKLSGQLEQSSVETSGISPVPLEVQDTDNIEENTAVDIPSKTPKTSPGSHDRKVMAAVATSSPLEPNLFPMSSAPRDKAAVSVAQCSAMAASGQPQNMFLTSSATVSKRDPENNQNGKKISDLKVIYAYPPFVPVKYEDINFDDYTDCILDDGDLARELSD